MALGEYVSVSSQRDTELAQLATEKRELAQTPDAELAELAAIYQAKGLTPATAHTVAVDGHLASLWSDDLSCCGMTVQIAVKLDDGLAEQVRAAAADAGTNLSEWVRAALSHQALVAKSMRARAEEDARAAVYTDEQEAALMAARRRRAIAALDEQ